MERALEAEGREEVPGPGGRRVPGGSEEEEETERNWEVLGRQVRKMLAIHSAFSIVLQMWLSERAEELLGSSQLRKDLI